jgi:FAD dependent oxidoreductase TIGR03364
VSPDGRAVVAGGGVLGTWHALELVRAGWEVVHLEAAAAPTSASVRNFGLVWVSGRREGEELDVALRARRRWHEIGAEVAGVGFRANGSLTVACNDDERSVMEAFARLPAAAARDIAFVEPDEVKEHNPAVAGEVTGGLHCGLDAVVEPRRALGALRDHLAHIAPERYRFRPGRRVVAAEPGATLVDTSGTRWSGDLAIVATGADYDHLPGTTALAGRLQRVRLQMLETEPFGGALTTSLADADTMRYYPAFAGAPLAELGPQSPVAATHHMQLLLVQRPDGGLTVGDTHAYDEPFDFALSEGPTVELLARAARILGAPLPPVRRRWEGVYAQRRDGAVCLREEIQTRVVLVTGPGGRGMTCAPAIAADTLEAAGVAVPA